MAYPFKTVPGVCCWPERTCKLLDIYLYCLIFHQTSQ